jgi:adenine-specific DNA-methyltransferase
MEDTASSYHATHRLSKQDIFDNRLISGDNLLALRALEQEFTGKVKCIYIDPPFNTKQAMEHYDDGIEHSVWLSLMRDRVEILHRLLTADGTLFVHIDDNELGYLIVLLDSIFGRANRLYVVTFKQGSATGHKSINPGCVNTTNFILMYAKDKANWKPNRMYTGRERDTRYGQFIVNVDDDYRRWQIITLTKAYASTHGLSEKEARQLFKEQPEALDNFVLKNASSVVRTARPDYDAVSEAARGLIDKSKKTDAILRLEREDHSDMYFKKGERILFYADKLKLIDGQYIAGEPLTTLWDDVLSNNLHNEGGVDFPKGKKPEFLIKRVLELTTSPGDTVLDSFAGSGTTGAVAHKMGRRWIMVELGEHYQTHIIPRLTSVIDGRDNSGITEAAQWKGGGGFRYFKLAPSLLAKDLWGNWVISREYNAVMVAEAVCKLEGFVYQPSDAHYWMHGRSSERDFIYVTTQSLTHAQLGAISEDVGDDRSLLICCKAFRANLDAFPNLTVKKIPKAVLRRCEWGRDDYSLSIRTLPMAEEASPQPSASNGRATRSTARALAQSDFFAGEAGK